MGRLIFVNDWGKMVVHLILGLCLVLGFGVGNSWGQDFSAAVFYGANPPWDELKAFNVVVVEPEHGFNPEEHRTSTSELFAYVSLGEVLPSRAYAQDIPEEWIIGENKAWESKIVDQTQDEWAWIRSIPINWFNKTRRFRRLSNMVLSRSFVRLNRNTLRQNSFLTEALN
jgi:hypothetical protein